MFRPYSRPLYWSKLQNWGTLSSMEWSGFDRLSDVRGYCLRDEVTRGFLSEGEMSHVLGRLAINVRIFLCL